MSQCVSAFNVLFCFSPCDLQCTFPFLLYLRNCGYVLKINVQFDKTQNSKLGNTQLHVYAGAKTYN
uniref:Uncharacterized protein n=1 Tax=Arundo donax TaxID=35708 RepID=A0A0A9GL01_ARUDO